MAASAHLKKLKSKHATLEKKIKIELKSPQPDTIILNDLKKQKLRLKEQITSLNNG